LRAASAEFDIGFLRGWLYGIWYASEEIVKADEAVETLKTRAT
jgi:hypothetical protein